MRNSPDLGDACDLHDPALFADPYPIYRQLRTTTPVHLDGSLGCWVVTPYAHVVRALANRSLSSERTIREAVLRQNGWQELAPLFKHISNLMFFCDPPKHTHLHSLVSKALSPRMVEQWRVRIQHLVNALLEPVQDQGHMDIIATIAEPLPMQVISDMLGIPPQDQTQFKLWSRDLAIFLGNPPTLDHCQRLLRSIQEFMDYFRGIVAQHQASPQSDLLDALLHAEDQGVTLTADELLINCVGLFTGGHETTTNLIGNGVLALLRHPTELKRLQANPSLITSAVEELLRYDSPVQFTARIAKLPTEIGGVKISTGQRVMLMLGSANRDPLQFPDPDRLDISRQENRHLAFGHNIHYCVGAALARLEAQIAINTLLHKMPNLGLQPGPLQWQENLSFHGLKALPVAF